MIRARANTFRVQKKTDKQAWRSSATTAALIKRAQCLRQIREYFAGEGVLEVDTPLLMPFGAPDPSLSNFSVQSPQESSGVLAGYLQTSPEFAMKRLLADGSGDIYQLGHAFRAEQPTQHHSPEFALLEWYRLGFDHYHLMDDVQALVAVIVPWLSFSRCRYKDVFAQRFDIDPHSASTDTLLERARDAGIELGARESDRDLILDALFSDACLRTTDRRDAMFVYDFPLEQAAYARIAEGPPAVAQRFELLIGGLEIANGYFEVTDHAEQLRRHRIEKSRREALGLPVVEVDPCFLEAMASGLPECSGVALGVDRLLMVVTESASIQSTTSFSPYS